MADRVLKVMVSSTFRDLKAEREAARDAILSQKMLPLMMETDSAIPDRGLLTNSFKMVDDADIYIVLISNYRYGQIIQDPDLNPKNLSITELEFERAAAANKKICAYLMDDNVPPPSVKAVHDEAATKDQLDAFRARARHPGRIAADFSNIHDLKQKITQTLADLRHGHTAAPSPPETTPIPRPGRCVGRNDETAKIVATLTAGSNSTAVLIQGQGGIGKTTLTQEAASHPSVIDRFGDRRWFAELETATDQDTFDAQILLALGLDPTQRFPAALHRLAQAPSLLVLDNLETPWEAAGQAIEARLATLAAIPGLVLLASFRGQEAIGGARWTLRHRLEPLPPSEARALFLDITETIPQDDPNLPALLDALGGVPLAISLTARRAARHADLAGVWAEWQRTGPDFATWQGAGPGRLTSVPHSIALSLRSTRMNPDAHRLFALLGKCPAGLATADRTTLLGDAAFPAESALVAVGLAYHRGPRLDLLPPVRDYALRHGTSNQGDTEAWCRHFLHRVQTQGSQIFNDGGAEALADLTPDIANIDAALRAAPDLSLRHTAVAVLNNYDCLLIASGLGSVLAIRLLAEACHSADDKAGEAKCRYREGEVSLARTDQEGANAAHRRAARLFHELGMDRDEANCIRSLGDTALRRSDHDTARSRYQEALALCRRVGDMQGEANCIFRLGDIALARSDHDTARSRYQEARQQYRRVQDVLGEANCIQRLGDITLASSDNDAAGSRYQEALPLYRRVGDVKGEANCIQGLGDIALARSDHDTARSRYQEALPLYRRVGDVIGEAGSVLGLGDVSRKNLLDAESEHRYAAALALYERVHSLDNVAIAHERLASVTNGEVRASHIKAAQDTWRAINLPDKADRVARDFP
jgi:tetratricopeptide (TPR) repeat protein